MIVLFSQNPIIWIYRNYLTGLITLGCSYGLHITTSASAPPLYITLSPRYVIFNEIGKNIHTFWRRNKMAQSSIIDVTLKSWIF